MPTTPENDATILVTAAGAAATAARIGRLRRQGFRVIAVDSDPDAEGLYLADSAYTVPEGTAPDFLPTVRRICAAEGVRAIVPLVDEELVAVWDLAGDGVEILLPHAAMVALCLDKLDLMSALRGSGIGTPRTRLAADGPGDLAYPLVVKPRTGRGGRGVRIARTADELRDILAGVAAPDRTILQEYVAGAEFSVSVVVWRDGHVQAVVPKQVVVKEGSSRYAVSRRSSAITATCVEIAHALDADGPFNVQLRLDGAGVPRVFEINPRFSGSAALTAASGVDEVGGLIAQALGLGRPRISDEWRDGVAMIRHATETFVPEARFTERRGVLVQRQYPEGHRHRPGRRFVTDA